MTEAFDVSGQFKFDVLSIHKFETECAPNGFGLAYMTSPGNITEIAHLVWAGRLHAAPDSKPDSGLATLQEYMEAGARLGDVIKALGEAAIRDGFLDSEESGEAKGR